MKPEITFWQGAVSLCTTNSEGDRRSPEELEVNISSSVRSRIVNHLEIWKDDKEFCSIETIQSILDNDKYHHIDIFEKAYNEISIMLYQNMWNKYLTEEIKNSMC